MVLARVVIHVLARVLPHVLARVLLHVLVWCSMVLARVVIHVLARVLPHVLARVLLHVLARVITHVHDYYSKTCPLDCCISSYHLKGRTKRFSSDKQKYK